MRRARLLLPAILGVLALAIGAAAIPAAREQSPGESGGIPGECK